MKHFSRARGVCAVHIMVISMALSSGCSRDMQEQPSFESQEAPRKHSAMGSVPRDTRTVVFSQPTRTEELVREGASLFAINCAHCHGTQGKGNGPVAPYLKERPANLHALDVQNKLKSELYEIVTNGKDAMPSFRGELSAQERWAIVSFVTSFSTESH